MMMQIGMAALNGSRTCNLAHGGNLGMWRPAGRSAGRQKFVVAYRKSGVVEGGQAGMRRGSSSRIEEIVKKRDEGVAAQISGKKKASKAKENRVLLEMNLEELESFVEAHGQPKYRGKQLKQGLFQGKRSIEDIQNVPKALREKLIEAGMRTGRSQVHEVRKAKDGTLKFLLRLHDDLVVETVGIPADKAKKPRLTVCVSSQVGCPLKCSFCATGKGGFSRNLTAHEIIDQVLTVQEHMQQRVSNIVFMGMGEPLLNIKAVVKALHVINKDIGIGARMITISTVGVPNAIQMLAKHKLQSVLAVSLHAPNQQLREKLIPSAKVYPLDDLLWDCQQYFHTTGRRVTFEYTVMAGVNDSEEQAQQLQKLLSKYKMMTHVNLIPWNPVAGMDFNRPSRQTLDRFMQVLEQHGITSSIRLSRGLDAAAACGQLRNDFQKKAFRDKSATPDAGI